MGTGTSGLFIAYENIWLLDGVRTPFVDYNGAWGLVSPIDLGIKVARVDPMSTFTDTFLPGM